jgi:uncharacterized protein YbaP (TraB family)
MKARLHFHRLTARLGKLSGKDLPSSCAMNRAADTALAAIGAVHMALLATLAAIFMIVSWQGVAQAAGPVAGSCGGENLLDKLRKDDPAAHDAVLDAAAQTPFGDTLLFRIDKPGTAPSWLFGTMHLTDERVTELPAAADNALENASIIAIETLGVLDPVAMQRELMSRPDLTMFVDERRLSDFMDEDQRAIIEAGLAARGMRLALVDRMKPWILTGMLSVPGCEMARKQSGAEILDISIARHAENNGKELAGLETVMEQLDAMASLPMTFHVQGITDVLRNPGMAEDAFETMIQLYEDGQIGVIWPLLRHLYSTGGNSSSADDETNAVFEEVMVNIRNQTMVERSLDLLEKGNAFIAVGALHLPGEKGLASLYEKAGYTVTPIYD